MTDTNTPNTPAAAFRRSISSLFRGKSETQKNLSEDPKVACDLVLKLLIAYEDLDPTKKPIKPSKLPLRRRFSLMGNKDPVVPQDLTLAKYDFSFPFCLLNLTLGEFYSSYQAFHHQFDSKSSSQIEEKEFQAMLDFLCRRDNMGKAKVRKSLEICSPEEFNMYNKIALLNPSPNDQLEEFLKKGMFTVLSVKETKANSIGSRSYIHYLRFFPITLSYFGEFIKKRVALRLTNMELICGLNSKRQRVVNLDGSYLDKLEHLGCKYEGDEYPTLVSFSSLEKGLILLRNSYSATFGPEQLQMILKELLKKCKVKDGSEREDRSIRLTYKLLRWISYRICLHCSLYTLMKEAKENSNVPRFKILEEYTIWAAAYLHGQFDEGFIERGFRKYSQKRFSKQSLSDLDDDETRKLIISTLKGYLRKLMPHISELTTQKIFEAFYAKMKADPDNNDVAGELCSSIYDLVIQVANKKLVELLESVYKSLKTSSSKGENKVDAIKKWFVNSKKDGERSSRSSVRGSTVFMEKDPEPDPSPSRPNLNDLSLSVIAMPQSKEHARRTSKSYHSRRGSIFSMIDMLGGTEEKEPANDAQEPNFNRKASNKSVTSIGDIEKSISDLGTEEKLDVLISPTLKRRSLINTDSPQSNPTSSLIRRMSIFSPSEAASSLPEKKLDLLGSPGIQRRSSLNMDSPHSNPTSSSIRRLSIFSHSEGMSGGSELYPTSMIRRPSIFSPSEAGKGDRRGVQSRKPTGLRIDLGKITEDDDDRIVVKSAVLQKRLHFAEEQEDEENLRNAHTGRTTDVVKSLFIAQAFLERYAQKKENSSKGSKQGSNHTSPRLSKQGSGSNHTSPHLQRRGSDVSSPQLQRRGSDLSSPLSTSNQSFRLSGGQKQRSSETSRIKYDSKLSWSAREPKNYQEEEKQKEEETEVVISKMEKKSPKLVKSYSTESRFKSSHFRNTKLAREHSTQASIPSTNLQIDTQGTILTENDLHGGLTTRSETIFEKMSFKTNLKAQIQAIEDIITEEIKDEKAEGKVKVVSKKKKRSEFLESVKNYKLRESDQIQFVRVAAEPKTREANYCGTGSTCTIF